MGSGHFQASVPHPPFLHQELLQEAQGGGNREPSPDIVSLPPDSPRSPVVSLKVMLCV